MGSGLLELGGEGCQLGDLVAGVLELGRDEPVEALLDRPAAVSVPDGDQVGDLLQGAARCLARPMNASRATARSS